MLDYIVGVRVGDGTQYYNRRTGEYVIDFYDKHREYLEIVRKILNELGYKSYITDYGNYSRLRVYSKELYYTIMVRATELTMRPNLLFVRGVADAEGTLYYDKRKNPPLPVVEIANTKTDLIINIYDLVSNRLGIKCTVKKYIKEGRKTLYKLVFRGSGAQDFIKIVKPIHPKFNKPFTIAVHPPPKPAH